MHVKGKLLSQCGILVLPKTISAGTETDLLVDWGSVNIQQH